MRTTMTVPGPKGFTLTELMVVIVIIAVLATLGFVVANRVKESATVVTCSNNLRQIALALGAHQADFKRYPGRNEGTAWDRKLLPYLGYDGSKDLRGNASLSKSMWPEMERAAAHFICSSDRYQRDEGEYKRSYAIVPWTTNWTDGTNFRGWKNRPYNQGVPLQAVGNPVRAAVVVEWHAGDEGVPNLLGSNKHAYHDVGGPIGNDRDLHRKTQIVLFADGHTEVLPFMSGNEFVDKYWPGTIGKNN